MDPHGNRDVERLGKFGDGSIRSGARDRRRLDPRWPCRGAPAWRRRTRGEADLCPRRREVAMWSASTRALRNLIEGRVVVCDERDRDSYGRVVAVCRHDGTNVNAWLVTNGWAMAYRRHSLAYVDAESTAKSARRGIWRGDFVPPWDWRQTEAAGVGDTALPSRTARTRSQRPASAPGRCNVKGNISYNSGRRLYHMPGDPDYADTRISVARGERWFCSEAEARAAGWQPAVRSKR